MTASWTDNQMFASEISKQDLHSLKLARFEGNIHLFDKPGAAESAIDRLKTCPVLGFDTETRPSFTRGKINQVALLQLATASDAFLFRLCKMGIPKSLLSLLSDPNILKVGAALKNDMDVLKRSTKIKPEGFIDLQNLAQEFEIKTLGLASMAGIVLGVRVSKSQQLSNWENNVLTEAQKRYAATDAWMCFRIYEKMIEKLEMKN